jgi:hypothetical protein
MKALEDIRKLIQKIIIVTALVDVSELALSWMINMTSLVNSVIKKCTFFAVIMNLLFAETNLLKIISFA